jgi:hypothetical protein
VHAYRMHAPIIIVLLVLLLAYVGIV